jgi:8-oxo-dGTP pyrophosphatase MutT (NUDIX family)
MVPAGETPRQALVREAREEAGLDLDRLDVASGGRLHVRRPVPEGYQSEIVQVFDAVLPAQMQPQNEDGEVAQIEARTGATVLRMIERDEFTLEAALVVLDHRLRSA